MRRLRTIGHIGMHLRELQAILGALFAVTLWGALPVIREQAAAVPPLQTAAIALICASTVETLRVTLLRPNVGHRVRGARLGARDGTLLAISLVGAIAFYFVGLEMAPATQVTLITYIWPLIFVAATELQIHGRLRPMVVLGALIAFAGAAVLIARDLASGLALDYLFGYAAGIVSGVCWVIYSMTLRRRADLGQEAFPAIFAVGAVLAAAIHLGVETTLWPLNAKALAVCALIGIGPYGLAFIAWANGIRNGPPRIVGNMAYGVPVITALLLIALGMAEPTWHVLVGGVGVIAGVAFGNAGRKGQA